MNNQKRRVAVIALLLVIFFSCKEKKQQEQGDHIHKDVYTCPMHPEIIRDKPGSCPICGMDLVLKTEEPVGVNDISLNVLLKPANEYIISSVATVHVKTREEPVEIVSYGMITYDTRQTGAIASYISGRIEKLYVRYRYQPIKKGQKIMDIYSPELLSAQENLLFLLKNDPENDMLIAAAKQKLLLLGMSRQQLEQVVKTGKTHFTVSVYSPYSGHIHESGVADNMPQDAAGMRDVSLITSELLLKEGMYVQKGRNIFSVYDPSKAWAVLNIFSGQASMVNVGDKVRIVPETAPQKDFRAAISFIEPFYRDNNKTVSTRVYFDNSKLNIPIGSQVKATIFAGDRQARWLPEEAVLSLGIDKVVFVKEGDAFVARKIGTGIVNRHLVQVLSGLSPAEEVAANAQYLVDSESFIKVRRER